MKRYDSKIGWGLIIFLVGVIGGSSIILIWNHAWVGVAINLALVVFIGHLFMSTYYVIDGRNLLVKCGFLINLSISIDSITRIRETNNPLSSPAVSLDRIEIYYNKWDSVMISPKEKLDFLRHITEVNPGIEVVLKKGKFVSAV